MTENTVASGIERYIARLKTCRDIYTELVGSVPESTTDDIYRVTNRKMFEKIIRNFVTVLEPNVATGDLMEIYDIALHITTKALVIANKGATLFSTSNVQKSPHIIRHIGLCVYMPGIGMEYANVGIVGDVYNKKFVLRSESACTPSFIFGSQRCNCYHQWQSVRELAASFNTVDVPNISTGNDFEKWVQQQFCFEKGRHIYQQNSELGFVMLHVDSQNGMGSGYTEGEFVFDLSERASMRHRGEYTAEQTYDTSMYGGFTTIGLKGDPRSQNDLVGYKITPVIMDFLGVNKSIIMLTNNPHKLRMMEQFGYDLTRVKTIGAVNVAGIVEARERGTEFNHMDINEELMTFSEDYDRVRSEIKQLTNVSKGGRDEG